MQKHAAVALGAVLAIFAGAVLAMVCILAYTAKNIAEVNAAAAAAAEYSRLSEQDEGELADMEMQQRTRTQ